MGIDVHGLNFLRYAKTQKAFGKTVTIGRQEIHFSTLPIIKKITSKRFRLNHVFCEPLLKDAFGASTVDSIDNSNYQKATILQDMNQPLKSKYLHHYDTVIDGGCLEHVYQIPQALKNLSLLCKEMGQIIHILPANNACGHGFWQFSPELFLSLYSEKNGFINTEIFLTDFIDFRHWYKVNPQSPGTRINIYSHSEVFILVRTVLRSKKFSHESVQQSDYVFEWSQSKKEENINSEGFTKKIFKRLPFLYLYPYLLPIYQAYQRRHQKLNTRNPQLTQVKITSLVHS
jgi:hypothetical protein